MTRVSREKKSNYLFEKKIETPYKSYKTRKVFVREAWLIMLPLKYKLHFLF